MRAKDFWKGYFDRTVRHGPPWLDYSNDRMQAQTLALALEAGAPLRGLRCLDIGSGRGELCMALRAFQARAVTGIDFARAAIQQCRRQHSGVSWECIDARSGRDMARLGTFDRVFAVEILQCLMAEDALHHAWARVVRGGRLIGVVPNGACPIVSDTIARFNGRYTAPRFEELRMMIQALADIDYWAVRGLSFQCDQRVAPYLAGPWTSRPRWKVPPNRFLFVVMRRE